MKRFEPCPCGSGRPKDACCGGRKALNLRMLVVAGLILVVGGALTALGLTWPSGADHPSFAATPGETPDPWEYDRVNDRHWHAGHGHWHPGPPPPESGAGQQPQTITPTVTPGESTPLPWQYDEENNRHWHPEHGHWHDGPPPEGVQ